MWKWVIPALPESLPPMWASTTTCSSSRTSGCGARSSETAISPTPITLSTTMKSLRMESVKVVGGMP